MPELPDLQVFSKNLTKKLKNKTVAEIIIHNKKKINASQKDFKDAIEGNKIKSVERVGKELHVEFDGDVVLSLHLMLRGQLHFIEDGATVKYPIIEMKFTDHSALIMSDFQGQATPTLNPEERESPDALSNAITFAFLKSVLQKSKAAIKNILLDQHIIRGIGNAYADEILWKAGISPFSIANKIPDEKIKALVKVIQEVLVHAEQSILKSHPDIISGEVRDFLVIHNSKKKTSPTGAPIQYKMVSERKTYFTDEQELFN